MTNLNHVNQRWIPRCHYWIWYAPMFYSTMVISTRLKEKPAWLCYCESVSRGLSCSHRVCSWQTVSVTTLWTLVLLVAVGPGAHAAFWMAFLTFLSIQIKLGFLASVQKGFSELECLLRDVSIDFGVEVNRETQPWASQSGCTLKDFCSFGSYNHAFWGIFLSLLFDKWDHRMVPEGTLMELQSDEIK